MREYILQCGDCISLATSTVSLNLLPLVLQNLPFPTRFSYQQSLPFFLFYHLASNMSSSPEEAHSKLPTTSQSPSHASYLASATWARSQASSLYDSDDEMDAGSENASTVVSLNRQTPEHREQSPVPVPQRGISTLAWLCRLWLLWQICVFLVFLFCSPLAPWNDNPPTIPKQTKLAVEYGIVEVLDLYALLFRPDFATLPFSAPYAEDHTERIPDTYSISPSESTFLDMDHSPIKLVHDAVLHHCGLMQVSGRWGAEVEGSQVQTICAYLETSLLLVSSKYKEIVRSLTDPDTSIRWSSRLHRLYSQLEQQLENGPNQQLEVRHGTVYGTPQETAEESAENQQRTIHNILSIFDAASGLHEMNAEVQHLFRTMLLEVNAVLNNITHFLVPDTQGFLAGLAASRTYHRLEVSLAKTPGWLCSHDGPAAGQTAITLIDQQSARLNQSLHAVQELAPFLGQLSLAAAENMLVLEKLASSMERIVRTLTQMREQPWRLQEEEGGEQVWTQLVLPDAREIARHVREQRGRIGD